MRCIHPSQRCISSRQMTDNIFEIETTALAHVACAPQESGVLLTDFAAAYPSVNHSWIFSVIENTGLPAFLCRFSAKYLQGQHHTRGIRGSRPRTINSLWSKVYDRVVQRVVSFLQCPSTRSSDGSKSQSSQGTRTTWYFAACPMRLRRRSRCCIILFSKFNDCAGTSISFCGFHCWPQFELSKMLLGSLWHQRT